MASTDRRVEVAAVEPGPVAVQDRGIRQSASVASIADLPAASQNNTVASVRLSISAPPVAVPAEAVAAVADGVSVGVVNSECCHQLSAGGLEVLQRSRSRLLVEQSSTHQ